MLLSREEAQSVFKLHSVLMQFVIDQLQLTDIAGPAMKYAALSPDKRREVIGRCQAAARARPLSGFSNWMGYVVDIRKSPVHLQRAAFEKGLIPYIPAERSPKFDPSSKL